MMELVTGGSGSGKSAYAESVICEKHRQRCSTVQNAPLYYIADMVPYGKETEKKIEAHRKMRAGKGFETLEWYADLPGRISDPDSPDLKGSCVLLECVSNLTANEMYEPGSAQNTGKDPVERIIKGVQMLKEQCAHLVVVTNDVFRESVPDSEEMRAYKENLAAVNRVLAKMADRVTEVVFGAPVRIKTGSDLASGSREHREETGAAEERAADRRVEERRAADRRMEEIAEREGRRRMKFITGGAYQGKLEYAKRLYPDAKWAGGAGGSFEELLSCGAVNHFHLFVRRWLREGRTPKELTKAILDKNSSLIIVCDEIGCGLVPVDAFERAYREAVGRICTELVKYADEVHRVTCGTGVRLR